VLFLLCSVGQNVDEFRRFMTKSTNAHAVVVSATFAY
jgi:hypothetical protein